ncbi:MAG: cell division protein FtsZ, partial [Halolamina sp.]
PLLDVDYRGASGGLVHITGGPDLTLKEAEGIADNITERLEASANVIWGARIQDEYKGKVRVMAIMTGVQSAQVLGPTTQKQAEKSRASIEGSASEFDASNNVNEWEADGGRDPVDRNNGLDVIR